MSVEATKQVAGRAMSLSPEEAEALQADLMRNLRASADHARPSRRSVKSATRSLPAAEARLKMVADAAL